LCNPWKRKTDRVAELRLAHPQKNSSGAYLLPDVGPLGRDAFAMSETFHLNRKMNMPRIGTGAASQPGNQKKPRAGVPGLSNVARPSVNRRATLPVCCIGSTDWVTLYHVRRRTDSAGLKKEAPSLGVHGAGVRRNDLLYHVPRTSKGASIAAGPALARLSPACGGSNRSIATDSTRILGMT
jgi:hypothetical protein